MLPVGFKAIVTRLDAGLLTQLMRALLQAEAHSLEMGAQAVVVSEALNEADGGLDARIDDVPAESATIPSGLVGFQFKAYKAKTISETELAEELAKPGPTRVLNEGGTYVLVWEADLNDKQRTAAQERLLSEASKIVENPKCQIWDASTIVGLSESYPAVVEALDLVAFGAVHGLPELEERLRMHERPYEPDDNRAQALEQIRERAGEPSEDAIVVTVSGLAGTGKTRLVAEALSGPDLRDRVLYADSAEGLQTFIARVVRDDRTSGILVVDELDDSDRDAIFNRFAATRGRWRLLAIVPQTTRRLRPAGARDIVLVPLGAGATRRLIEATSGLQEAQAWIVADVAQGFPELAFRLAQELELDPDLELVRLAHLDRPHDVLERALPEQTLRDGLKPLALFTGLGVEGDLAYQLDEVARAFGREPAELAHVMKLELDRHRFVSAAGRFRSVSPTLVAIWLAVELIDETPGLDNIIAGLSGPVQEAFYRQLELFGPEASQLAPALERLLEDRRFREPEAFDEAAASFLRASAAVVPSQVAASISQIVGTSDDSQVRALPRRSLITALQILLWWPETWESAAEALYRLARNETETWANNASGVFKDAFSVYLSGSTLPFEERIRWLATKVAAADQEDIPLLGRAAAQGLSRNAHRMVVGFRGGGEPDDWEPQTVGELRAARSAAWDQMLLVTDRAEGEQRLALVKSLSQGLLTMVVEGLLAKAGEDLSSREWTSTERAEFVGELQRVIRVGRLPEEVARGVVDLRDRMEGSSENDRVATLLATPLWELHDDQETLGGDPPILIDLAERVLVSDPGGVEFAVSVARGTADPNTRYRFLVHIGQRAGAIALAEAADRESEFDDVAYAAAMVLADGQGQGRWVDETLVGLANGENAQKVPLLAAYAGVTAERIGTALDAIERGAAPGTPLVNLRGGGRFLELPDQVVQRLLRVLMGQGAVEGALGMLLQLFEARESSGTPEWLPSLTLEFASSAMTDDSDDPMVEYYLTEFVKRNLFDTAGIAELWDLRMRTRRGLVEEFDQLLTERALADAPQEMLGRVLGLIHDEATGESSFSLFASRDLALLSRVSTVLGAEEVWTATKDLSEHEFLLSIHHMRWSGQHPDPLVKRFLSSEKLAGYETEAFTAFFNTLGTVSGDYWRALERERDRARNWRDDLEAPSARAWADELVARYDRDIEHQRLREEEEDFRLGR